MTKNVKKIDILEIEDLIKSVESRELDENKMQLIQDILSTFNSICFDLKEKNISIQRLRNLLGIKTEKLPRTRGCPDSSDTPKGSNTGQKKPDEKKNNGSTPKDDTKAKKTVHYKIESLVKGQHCPECSKGKLYFETSKQQSFDIIVGNKLFEKENHTREVLTCNCCKQSYKAELPPEVNPKKGYAPSACALACTLRYITGFPHYRLKYIMPVGLGISPSTLFNMAEDLSDLGMKIFYELKRQAANSYRVGIDDTRMKILNDQKIKKKGRKSTRTTGLISELNPPFFNSDLELIKSPKVCLFETGSQVAGEYFDQILDYRNKEGPILLMADALAANNPQKNITKYIRTSCLVHARRNFWNIKDNYPESVPEILFLFSEIFRVEKECCEENIIGKERLLKLRKECGHFMSKIWWICRRKLRLKEAEPNSSFGKALKYFLKHFKPLCGFMHFLDCPLENNESERLLKRIIQHRKNSLFYKTNIGSGVGDVIMSLGFTALEAGIDIQNYFEDILINFKKSLEIGISVKDWLPWNWAKNKS